MVDEWFQSSRGFRNREHLFVSSSSDGPPPRLGAPLPVYPRQARGVGEVENKDETCHSHARTSPSSTSSALIPPIRRQRRKSLDCLASSFPSSSARPSCGYSGHETFQMGRWEYARATGRDPRVVDIRNTGRCYTNASRPTR